MGTSRQRQRNRSDLVKFPKTALQAVKTLGDKEPRLKLRRPAKGAPIAPRSRLTTYGLTAEERLMLLSPDEGSKPEKMIYGWLMREGIPFEYQVPLMGGRVPGGAIVDFIISLREPPFVIRVMSYHHTLPDQKTRDDLQKDALEMLGWRVEDVWEYEVTTADKTRYKMMELLYGTPKPTGLSGTSAPEAHVCPRCGDPDCTEHR